MKYCSKSLLPTARLLSRLLRQLTVVVVITCPLLSSDSVAANESSGITSDILSQCRRLSVEADDIHNCLDNHLDVLDEILESTLEVISSELAQRAGSDDTLKALENAQRAFEVYRTENCLWYLAFSSPRSLAEQIAKNCLASMSEQRLAELQRLLKTADEPANSRGYYVYGTNRNTFMQCGSDKRYWIYGENSVVGELQQRYLNEATLQNQLLFVELAGEVDTDEIAPVEQHNGVFVLQSIGTMRAPTDSDCSLPAAGLQRSSDAPISENTAETADVSDADAALPDQSQQKQQPEQSLIAYFSDWTASCKQLGTSYGCELSAPLQAVASDAGSLVKGLLRITRRSDQRTIVDIELPDPFIELVSDVDQIEWRVDAIELGKLLHSQLSKVEGGAPRDGQIYLRQALRERWYIRDHLLPVLFRGNELILAVMPPEQALSEFKASLVGLTRAIAFADDFTAAEGEIK